MSWAMKMAVWGRTSSWGHRRTWKSCSLVCWRSPWAFSLLCPSCNTNNSQSPCKRTSKTVLLSPFVTFCKMWSASSAGMSTPSAAATVNPSLTLAFYHCHILGDRPLIKYCRLSIVVTPVVSRTFLHSLHYNTHLSYNLYHQHHPWCTSQACTSLLLWISLIWLKLHIWPVQW